MAIWIAVSALLVGLAALVMAFMAVSRTSDSAKDIRRLRNEFNEFSGSLRQKLEVLAKKVSSATPPTSFIPTNKPATPSAGPPSRPTAPRAPPKVEARPPPPPEPTMINFDCIHCEQNIDAPPEMAGLWVACPTCKQAIQVPGTATARGGVAEVPEQAVPAGAGLVADEEEASKGQTVRIDLSQMFAEMAERPKRQVVIRRRQ